MACTEAPRHHRSSRLYLCISRCQQIHRQPERAFSKCHQPAPRLNHAKLWRSYRGHLHGPCTCCNPQYSFTRYSPIYCSHKIISHDLHASNMGSELGKSAVRLWESDIRAWCPLSSERVPRQDSYTTIHELQSARAPSARSHVGLNQCYTTAQLQAYLFRSYTQGSFSARQT